MLIEEEAEEEEKEEDDTADVENDDDGDNDDVCEEVTYLSRWERCARHQDRRR